MEHDHEGQAIVCVSAISLPALENAQRLIKPLRACYPDLPILAGLWDAAPQTRETDLAELLGRRRDAGCHDSAGGP